MSACACEREEGHCERKERVRNRKEKIEGEEYILASANSKRADVQYFVVTVVTTS